MLPEFNALAKTGSEAEAGAIGLPMPPPPLPRPDEVSKGCLQPRGRPSGRPRKDKEEEEEEEEEVEGLEEADGRAVMQIRAEAKSGVKVPTEV